jgi:hypothetical protein
LAQFKARASSGGRKLGWVEISEIKGFLPVLQFGFGHEFGQMFKTASKPVSLAGLASPTFEMGFTKDRAGIRKNERWESAG